MNELYDGKIFANNLNHYMKINNVDRNKLCKDLGFKYTTVREWTNGTAFPRIDKVEMLANYFNIQKSDLIEDNGQANLSELDEALFSKAKELTDEEKRAVITVMNAIKKDIDEKR